MKKIFLILFILSISIPAIADGPGSIRLEIAEEDGSPSDFYTKLKFPNASLTDNSDGTVSVAISGSLADADYGDITVSGSGATWTIDNDVVNDLKIDWGLGANQVAAADIPVAILGTPTYTTLQHFVNLSSSAGRISGGAITDDGTADGKVSIAAGTGWIKATDSDVAELNFFDWAGSANVDIPANTTRFIGVTYNSGTPIISVSTTQNWDYDTSFPLGIVVNEADVLSIVSDPWWTGDPITNIIERFQAEGRIVRDDTVGGLILGNTGTRQPTLTGGTLWGRLNEFTVSALTGGETFETYYYDGDLGGGAAWVKGTGTQWDNLNYNTVATGLTALGTGKYANLWWFVDVDGTLIMLYGQDTYTTAAQAAAGTLPTTVPSKLQYTALFVGRIVFQQNNDTPLSIDSAFSSIFTPGVTTDHGNLVGLLDDDHTQYLLDTQLDDTKGNGDTTYIWSADKVYDQLALKENVVTEGSLADSTIVSADIKDGTVTYADMVANVPGLPHHTHISIVNPNAVVTASTIIPVFTLTDAALTVTKIEVSTSSASYEAAGDLKYANARIGLASATVINDFDTTSGVRSDTSITSGAVASGKFVYLSFDTAPNASMTDMIITVYWDYD
jgi:hypothetical protein